MIKGRVCGYCGLCWRGGYGFTDRSQNIDEKFCSRAHFQKWRAKMKLAHEEIEAIKASLPAMASHVVEAGIGAKAFNDFTKDEICGFLAAAAKNYREELNRVILESDIPF